MNTIEINGWQGRLDMGLTWRELTCTCYAPDKTQKEIGRLEGISPATVKQAIDSAKFKLSKPPRYKPPHYIRTTKELVVEAIRLGIIKPANTLVLLLCIATGLGSFTDHPTRRPARAPKIAVRYVARQEVA